MAFNDSQPNVLVNPLPFISGVQDPTVIPRAAASYDAVAQGALQARAIGEPFSPKANAETQAAIAEANLRRKTAQDEEINGAKKAIVVAQGAASKMALEDLKFNENTRGWHEAIKTGRMFDELHEIALGGSKEAADAMSSLFVMAGQSLPRKLSGQIDTEAALAQLPEMNAWNQEVKQARAIQNPDNLFYQEEVRPVAGGLPGATYKTRVRYNKATGRPWTEDEQRNAVAKESMTFSQWKIRRDKQGGAPVAAPANGAPANTAPVPDQPGAVALNPPAAAKAAALSAVNSGSATPVAVAAGALGVSPKDMPAVKGLPAGFSMNALGQVVDSFGSVVTDFDPGKKEGHNRTESQYKAIDYAIRMKLGDDAYSNLIAQGFNPASWSTYMQDATIYPDFLRTDLMTVFDTIVDSTANAILRRDSGAAITADERASYRKMLFPVINDSPQAVELKRKLRVSIQETLRREGSAEAQLSPEELAVLTQVRGTHAQLGVKLPGESAPAAAANPLPGGAMRSPNPGKYYVQKGTVQPKAQTSGVNINIPPLNLQPAKK
jgi:hypothetical protein